MPTALSKVIRKLDRLDGKLDGLYTNIPLHITNSTGVCEALEVAVAAARKQGINVSVSLPLLRNPNGKYISIDCKELARKLNVLTDIATKNPATKFIALVRNSSGRLTTAVIPSPQELYGYHIVDHMITSLLYGLSKSTEPFHKLFSYISFQVYAKAVQNIGGMLKKAGLLKGRRYPRLTIKNATQAYQLFRALGKKYKFDTAAFKPRTKTPLAKPQSLS